MLPLTWEALATGANGLLGFIGSKYSADKSYKAQLAANEANLQAVRETNQANYKTWQEYANMQKSLAGDSNQLQRELLNVQQAFNASEAQKSRAFNSASAQVQRLIDAGLNPHGANAGSSESVASSGLGSPVTPSIPAPPNSIAGHVSPAADVGFGSGLKSVAEALGSLAVLSNARGISSSTNRSNERIADLRSKADERIANARNVLDERLANAANSISYDAQKNQERYTDHLIKLGNKQIESMGHQMKMADISSRQADEQLLINWFSAKSGAALNGALARQAASTANQIDWLTQNQLPADKQKTDAVIAQIREVTSGYVLDNNFNKSTLNARINDIIFKSDMSNTSRLLMQRSLRNLQNLDDKEYIHVLNSVLTFLGGSGLTPGYSVK